MFRTALLSFALCVSLPVLAQAAELRKVADFKSQVTGVAVSEDDRIFVNFPRWSEDAPVSVAEVKRDGSIVPYPDKEWNEWRNARKNTVSPEDHWVCVQSVVADGRGSLWVLDPAAPNSERIVQNGPKLAQIDLKTNKVVKVIAFDERAAPVGSYLNDVRFSPDGKTAFITDSGRGAIVVVDLDSRKSRRVLDGDKSTQAEPIQVKTDGKVLRRPDGRGVEFAADGIELSKDGKYLYWQALTGETLYRAPTSALVNGDLTAKDVAAAVEVAGENGVSDGLWLDKQGRMYLSALQDNAVKRRENGAVTTIAKHKDLRWPDSFAEGSDGAIYVTSSRIMDSAWFKPENGIQRSSSLWAITEAKRAKK